jgi:hypothetical protein
MFMAAIPGETIIQLLGILSEEKNVTFRDHLLDLLRSCTPGTVGLDESARSSRLSVCLDAVHRVARAAIVPKGLSPSPSLLSNARGDFASPGLMRTRRADGNPAILVIARSICVLLARNLLRKYPLEQPELG